MVRVRAPISTVRPSGSCRITHPAGIACQALGRSRGNVAHLFQLGLAGLNRIRQHRGVDVDRDLIALARRPRVELVVQGGLREQAQRVGLLLPPRRAVGRRASWVSPRSLVERLARGVEGAEEQGTRFRSQAATDHHRAVVGSIDLEHAALVLACGLADLVVPVHLTPALDDALHVHGAPATPDRKQAPLGLRGGDTSERAHLGVRELPARERLRQPGQRAQGARDAHVLASGAR